MLTSDDNMLTSDDNMLTSDDNMLTSDNSQSLLPFIARYDTPSYASPTCNVRYETNLFDSMRQYIPPHSHTCSRSPHPHTWRCSHRRVIRIRQYLNDAETIVLL